MSIDTLKYASDHVPDLLGRNKYMTFRYDADWDLSGEGDPGLVLLTPENEYIGFVKVLWSETHTARSLAGQSWAGHSNYADVDELLGEMAEYYPEADLGPSTELETVRHTPVPETVRGGPSLRACQYTLDVLEDAILTKPCRSEIMAREVEAKSPLSAHQAGGAFRDLREIGVVDRVSEGSGSTWVPRVNALPEKEA